MRKSPFSIRLPGDVEAALMRASIRHRRSRGNQIVAYLSAALEADGLLKYADSHHPSGTGWRRPRDRSGVRSAR